MTKHQQQNDQRHDLKMSGMPTTDELEMIRDNMVYSHNAEMIQKSMGDMKNSRISLKDLSLRCLEHVMQRGNNDRFALRKELNKRNIKLL